MTHARPFSGSSRLVLVTGPSGAGRTTSIRALEDLSYEVVDNLPLSLVSNLLESAGAHRPLAIGIDIRTRGFSVEGMIDLMDELRKSEVPGLELVYIDCNPDVLVRRFSETRRRHPMAPAETPVQGIERELDLLVPIRDRADRLIDTSEMTVHDLRAEITEIFAPNDIEKLAISIQSFSYKRGVPRGADLVFDCRFLRNPYWQESLRTHDGRDPCVREYIAEDERFHPFLTKVMDLCTFVLPAYRDEGKSHLSIAFGCTGGQHRSVMIAQELAKGLAAHGWQVSIRHRELDRRGRESGLTRTG